MIKVGVISKENINAEEIAMGTIEMHESSFSYIRKMMYNDTLVYIKINGDEYQCVATSDPWNANMIYVKRSDRDNSILCDHKLDKSDCDRVDSLKRAGQLLYGMEIEWLCEFEGHTYGTESAVGSDCICKICKSIVKR